MDSNKFRLIVFLAAGLLAAEVSSADALGKAEAPRDEDHARFLTAAVDAKTSASWRELTPEEDITADQLRAEQLTNKKLVILDARDDKSFDTLHIQAAVLPLPRDFYQQQRDYKAGLAQIPPDNAVELPKAMAKYPKDTPLVAYCNRDCKASSGLLLKLKNMGFTNVRAMEEGVQAWQGKGYPVTIGVPRLSLEKSE